MSESFAHLHVHTEFSMLDGASRVDEAVAAAAADGQPALGITDHGNMYGILPFYAACKSAGIMPFLFYAFGVVVLMCLACAAFGAALSYVFVERAEQS